MAINGSLKSACGLTRGELATPAKRKEFNISRPKAITGARTTRSSWKWNTATRSTAAPLSSNAHRPRAPADPVDHAKKEFAVSVFYHLSLVLLCLLAFLPHQTALADSTEQQCIDRLKLIASSEENKINDLVSYLQRSGIDVSTGRQSLELNASGVVPSPRTNNPIVGVSVSSGFASRRENVANDDAWVFGKIAGKVMIGNQQVYAHGQTFAVSTSLRRLASNWREANTSLALIGPNCQRHLNTFTATPSPMFSYLVTAAQLQRNPKAVHGFLQRFNFLVRHHWSN